MTLNLPRLPALARAVGGILIGWFVFAIVFLIMAQGAFHKGFTDFDFGHVLGTAIRGSAEEKTGADALGVVGDTAGPDALYASIAAAICLMVVHAAVIARLVRRHWLVQGVALGVVTFLAIGFVYVPYADANLDSPIGPWGSDQGGLTPLVLGLSGLGAAIVGARVYELAERVSWWETEEVSVDETLAELTGIEKGSLELPEQGAEQRVIGP